jgi:negative regulator of flagellin synthesis FlgM
MKVNQKAGNVAAEIDAKKTRDLESGKKSDGLGALLGGGENKSPSRVDVSDRARMAQKATDIAKKGLNDVDEAKVAHLQRLIDEGKYKVDAEALADKLVDEHLLMN